MKKNILGMQVHSLTYKTAVTQILNWVDQNASHLVYAANVHMLMEAYDSRDFKAVVNSADMVTPDGMPLVWMLRAKGIRGQGRVYGPTLMLHVLASAAQAEIPVGFYGSSHEVLAILVNKMKEKFPGLEVVYSYSPPFKELSTAEDQDICERIRISGARILFVGLGCPKQEIWMADHRGKVNTVMLGVGAAFDFHAGLKAQAPAWMQAVGLEWLFRLLHEPRRLARRYLYNNPRFVVLALLDLVGILKSGKKEA